VGQTFDTSFLLLISLHFSLYYYYTKSHLPQTPAQFSLSLRQA
jgi:hypothetical protein